MPRRRRSPPRRSPRLGSLFQVRVTLTLTQAEPEGADSHKSSSSQRVGDRESQQEQVARTAPLVISGVTSPVPAIRGLSPPLSKLASLGKDEDQDTRLGRKQADQDMDQWVRLRADSGFSKLSSHAFPSKAGKFRLSVRLDLNGTDIPVVECTRDLDFDAHPLPPSAKIHLDKNHSVPGVASTDLFLVRLTGFLVTCVRVFVPGSQWKAATNRATHLSLERRPERSALRLKRSVDESEEEDAADQSSDDQHSARSRKSAAQKGNAGTPLNNSPSGISPRSVRFAEQLETPSKNVVQQRQKKRAKATSLFDDEQPLSALHAEGGIDTGEVPSERPSFASYFQDNPLQLDTQRSDSDSDWDTDSFSETFTGSDSEQDFAMQEIAPSQMFPDAARELDDVTEAHSPSAAAPKQELQVQNVMYDHPLGTGSYARVFEGMTRKGRIAVKEFSGKAPRKNARNEAIVLCALDQHGTQGGKCNNVVQFLGWRRTAEGLYQIGLEMCDRGNLYNALSAKPTGSSSRRASRGHAQISRPLLPHRFRIIRGIVSAMVFVHGAGVIHADLSSLNVLLTNEWEPKVCDFNLSTAGSSIEPTGHGAERWMAPEMLRAKGEVVTSKIDVYSFGVILWELFHLGCTPWEHVIERRDIARAKLEGETLAVTFKDDGGTSDIYFEEDGHASACEACKPSAKPATPDHIAIIKRHWAKLMADCWSLQPSKRPTFKSLRKHIDPCSHML